MSDKSKLVFECVCLCCVLSSFLEKVFGQKVHLRSCFNLLEACENVLEQKPHWYGRSPVCVRSCVNLKEASENVLEQ